MNCPKCGFANSVVIDSRKTHNAKRRRRECCWCGHRYTCYEISSDDYKKLLKLLKTFEELQNE